MPTFNKATIVPLEWTHRDLWEMERPFELAPDLSVQSVKGTLSSTHFNLFKDFLSAKERESLPSVTVAIVHRFYSEEHVGRKESESKALCYRVFLALRLIKPTRSRYANIQYKVMESGEIDVFSFTHPETHPVNSPDAEAINRIDERDLVETSRILPAFMAAVASDSPEYLRRAIKYFDNAYASIPYPEIQFLTWVMGIESAVADQMKAPRHRSQLIDQVFRFVDPSAQIYSESPLREFLELPSLTVADVLPDVFRLRSTLAHGGWFPNWRPDVTRPTLSNNTLSYAEMLLEAAPFILRKLIIARLLHDDKRR
jgi:hypothetical protein